MSYSDLNFFSEGRGKGGDERTQTSLITRMGTPFSKFSLNENKMDEDQTHQTQNPFG